MYLKKIYWEKLIRQFILLLGFVLCFVAMEMIAVSCTSGFLMGNSEMNSMIMIRQANAGEYFTAVIGDTIEVLLDENPSTGYLWEVVKLDRNILVSLESSFFYTSDALLGSRGIRRFQFVVKAPGETIISFRLIRPWEKDASAIEQFQVTINAVKS